MSVALLFHCQYLHIGKPMSQSKYVRIELLVKVNFSPQSVRTSIRASCPNFFN
jgi:hypothetical protein